MNLAEIKACAARRTQGKWDARDWMCGDHDAEFIAMAANHIDALIAIAKAAKVFVCDPTAGPTELCKLLNALAALDAI